jgi:hypothetical protein
MVTIGVGRFKGVSKAKGILLAPFKIMFMNILTRLIFFIFFTKMESQPLNS